MVISIALIKHYRQQLSPWYVVCVLIYPITDTIFTIFEEFGKMSTMESDNQHLHHLIFETVSNKISKYERLKHVITTSIIFTLYTPFILFANTQRHFTITGIGMWGFILLYVMSYFALKKFLLLQK